MNKNVIINHKEMQNFINTFDVIKERFFYGDEDGENDSLAHKLYEFYIKKSVSEQYDIEQQVDTLHTIDNVYSMGIDTEEEYCSIVYKAKEKFLDEYVGITGLSTLYSSTYFSFEWMMHLEYDSKKHLSSYYRDHYIHQVRNLYEMYVFLEELDYWKKCKDFYLSGKGRISQKVLEAIHEEICDMNSCEYNLMDEVPHDVKEILFRYIIFSVAFTSALVHDIGYPIAYVRREASKLNTFLPLSHLFLQDGIDKQKIVSLLERSLLFQTVEQKEIIDRLSNNDHGALSAIILLEKYYDNGEIFKLIPSQRMVIELSALVIYNHTLRYEDMGQDKSNRYRMLYCKNPLSYLFRLCDDLQEWNRVYFEITKSSSLFICDSCMMPRMRVMEDDKSGDKKSRKYRCICKHGKGYNNTGFHYRKTINIMAGSCLQLLCNEEGELSQIIVEYDKAKLLEAAKYNAGYAVKRAEGIMESKKMLRNQPDFPKVFLDSFISNNPVAIKMEILKDFMERQSTATGTRSDSWKVPRLKLTYGDLQKDVEEFGNCLGPVPDHPALTLMLAQAVNKTAGNRRLVKARWKKSLSFYLRLIRLSVVLAKNREYIFKNCIKDKDDSISDALDKFFSLLANKICSDWRIKDYSLKILIADALLQNFCRVDADTYYSVMDKADKHKLESGELYWYYLLQREDITDVVIDYTKEKNYDDVLDSLMKETDENYFDFFSDYYLFFMLLVPGRIGYSETNCNSQFSHNDN